MTKFKNNFDGGTNGVGMTTGNTGGASGDAFTAVEPAAVFSNARAQSGALSMQPPSAAGSGLARWAAGTPNVATRLYARCDVAHTGDYILWQARGATSASSSGQASVLIDGANKLRVREQVGGTNLWTAAAAFPLNEWVRIEILIETGTTATSGRLRVAYYLGDNLTPIEDTGWLENLDLRGDTYPVGNVYLGKISTSAYAGSMYIDTIDMHTGADYTGSFIGPDVVPNTPPVADAGPHQAVLPGATVTVPGGGTDPDGDSLTYLWEWAWPTTGTPSLTGATTATASFTAGTVGEIYALHLTVDDGTDTSTSTVNIAVVESIGTVESNILTYDGTDWV